LTAEYPVMPQTVSGDADERKSVKADEGGL
jgi:hypothetical protein